jgi:methyl coenzyme M reductase alpha subunit
MHSKRGPRGAHNSGGKPMATLADLIATSSRRRQPPAEWPVEDINALADRLLNTSLGRSAPAGVSDLRAAAKLLKYLANSVPPDKMVVFP